MVGRGLGVRFTVKLSGIEAKSGARRISELGATSYARTILLNPLPPPFFHRGVSYQCITGADLVGKFSNNQPLVAQVMSKEKAPKNHVIIAANADECKSCHAICRHVGIFGFEAHLAGHDSLVTVHILGYWM